MNKKFFIFVDLGGGGFNKQTGSILVHIYPLTFMLIYSQYGDNLITFCVKIQNMKTSKSFIFGVLGGGGLHKMQGYIGYQMSANTNLITVETYVKQGKTINNQFFIYGPECDQKKCFGYLGALGRGWGVQ